MSALLPVRDGSREAPRPTAEAICAVCSQPLAHPRARYCSRACQQQAYRLRHHQPSRLDLPSVRRALQQQRSLVAHTVYACPSCEERYLGERRCPDCRLFCRAIGLGGRCPDCDAVILLADLLATEVPT